MIHFIYETTNKVNGKFYRGKHSTENIDDGYLGSGKILKDAILKYGKDSFKREILCMCDSESDAYELEELAVTLDDINNPMCYNISLGGNGVMMGRKHTEESKLKISQNNAKNAPWLGKKMPDSMKLKMSKSHTGQTRTGDGLLNIRDAQNRLSIIERTCPHCGKLGKGNAMLQWHFNNCKNKENLEKD